MKWVENIIPSVFNRKSACIFGVFLLVITGGVANSAYGVIPGSVPVGLNSTVAGALSANSPFRLGDVYSITTEHNGFLLVSVTPDAELDVWLRLLDSDGVGILTESNAGGLGVGEGVSMRFLNAGTYYLAVGLGAGAGSYNAGVYFTAADSVDAEPNDSPAHAIPLDANSQAVGNIGYRGGLYTDRYDYYSITLPDDGSLELTLFPDGDLRVALQLLDWDGSSELAYVDQSAAGSSEKIVYPNLAAGTYYCGVIQITGAGSYSLTSRFQAATGAKHPDPSAEDPVQVIALSAGADGSWRGEASRRFGYFGGQKQESVHIYRITLPAYGELNLNYEFTAGATQQAGLRVFDEQGRYLSETDSTSLSMLGLKAGNYYVHYFRRNGYGAYTLNAMFTGTPEPQTNVVNPSTIAPNGVVEELVLDANTPERFVMITLPQNGQLRITAGFSNSLNAAMNLMDEQGVVTIASISSYYSDQDREINRPNMRAGVYAIRLLRSGGEGFVRFLRTEFTPAMFSDNEPNDNYLQTMPVHMAGETLVGNIGYEGNGWIDALDHFLVRTEDDGELVVTITADSTLYYNLELLELHQGVITPVANGSSYYRDAALTLSKADRRAGDYLIRLRRYNGYGSYQIETSIAPNRSGDAEPNGHPFLAVNIEPNQGIIGTLGYVSGFQTDTSDWYRVVLPSAGSFHIHYQSEATLYDEVTLFRDDVSQGNRIHYASAYYNWNLMQVGASNLLEGTYYIQIRRMGGHGTYNFHTVYIPKTPLDTPLNDLPVLATAMNVGQVVQGSLGFQDHYRLDREDWYVINVPTDKNYTVTWQADSTLYGEMRVFSANSITRLAAENTYYNASLRSRTLNLSAGTYYLQTVRLNGHGTYTIWLGDPESVSYGTISGQVVSAQGMPLFEVNVTMPGRTLKSDFSGRFTFEQVPPGTHTLQFESGAKYYVLEHSVEVQVGQTASANVTLLEANVTPPSNPRYFYGVGRNQYAHLFWSPSVSHDVADGGGYMVAIDRGEYIDLGNVLVYRTDGLTGGRLYVFSLITYDKFGNQSVAKQIELHVPGDDEPVTPTPTPIPGVDPTPTPPYLPPTPTPTATPIPGVDPTSTPTPPIIAPTPTPRPGDEPAPVVIYEFDQPDLAANGWLRLPGGFSGLTPGSYALVDFPDGVFPNSNDNKGLQIKSAPGEVAFLFAGTAIDTQGHPILLRMTARADSAHAGVFLVGLKGTLSNFDNVDGSVVVLNPATSAAMTDQPKRLTLLFEPDDGSVVTPAVQVVSVDPNVSATVWVDRIEAFLLTPGVCFDGGMFSSMDY